MVPPPAFLMDGALVQLKRAVTGGAVTTLQAFGRPVLAEGNQVLVPGHSLFVADACSGLTSIVTMLPFACIVAYYLGRGTWRRAVVIASVLPLALGANFARVLITILMVTHLGGEAAQGLLHETFGLATYTLGTLALVGVARGLR
jgi:exosortase